MTVTFEDAWLRQLPAPDALAQQLPTIDEATADDRQVVVFNPVSPPGSERRSDPPASLDGLAGKPWVESVVLGWYGQARVPLPGVKSVIGLHQFGGCDADTLASMPNLEQLMQHDVPPEQAAAVPKLRDAIFDWYTPAGDQHRRTTSGAAALAGLHSIERLRIPGLHYQEPADPLAELTGLRWLSLQGWRNLRVLGRLTGLESLELLEFEMANLRAFHRMTQLRELALMGRMKSLDGIEALTALEDVWLRGRVVRDLSPLADLPNLVRLTLIYPDAVTDFSPIGRLRELPYLEMMLGDDTDVGPLPSIDFLAGLEQLQDVRLFNVEILDRRLDPLFDLPRLSHVWLTGQTGPNVDELRRRRPDIDITLTLLGEPDGRVHVGPVHYDPPAEGTEHWSIFQSLANALGTETNHEAERRIQKELRRRDAKLLGRLEFDSEAGAVGIYAASEADIRSVAELVADLTRGA